MIFRAVLIGLPLTAAAYIFTLAWIQSNGSPYYDFADLIGPRLIDVVAFAWLFWVAASIGSFLNVVAWRMPLGMSLNGRSACPRCRTKLALRDNIPVLGWLALGARCRTCRLPISPRYPIVEAIVGVSLSAIGIAEVYQISLPYQPPSGRPSPLGMPRVGTGVLVLLAYHAIVIGSVWACGLIRFDGHRLPTRLVIFSLLTATVPLLIFPTLMVVPWKAMTEMTGSADLWISVAPMTPNGRVDALARVITAFAAAGMIGRCLAKGLCPTADPKLNPLGGGTARLMDLVVVLSLPALVVGWQALLGVVVVASLLARIARPVIPSSCDTFGRFALCLPMVVTAQIVLWRWLNSLDFWPGPETSPRILLLWGVVILLIPLWMHERSADPDESGLDNSQRTSKTSKATTRGATTDSKAVAKKPLDSETSELNDMNTAELPYDSFLIVSFGGPEGQDDVLPFLENVLRGKNVPRSRMMEVAEHYRHFGGVSPINQQNRELIQAVETDFRRHGIELPIYWGNRNWEPLLPETIARMRDDGCKRTLAFFTNVFSCYSGCRQYRENIAEACEQVGEGAPVIEKVRMGFNHPGFVEALAEHMNVAADSIDADLKNTKVLFTAHSIPMNMAENCSYERQLTEASRLVAEACGAENWNLVYQSRSGPPQQPWLEPDVLDSIKEMHRSEALESLIILPIGFVSDHMEVMFDLDEEAATLCKELGIRMARAKSAGTHPAFVAMIRKLVQERLGVNDQKESLGPLGPWHDVCPVDCCLYTPKRPGAASQAPA